MGVPLLRALGAPPDKAGEETWDPEDVDSRTPRINPPPLSTPPPGVENSPGNISKDGDTYIVNSLVVVQVSLEALFLPLMGGPPGLSAAEAWLLSGVPPVAAGVVGVRNPLTLDPEGTGVPGVPTR